MKPTAILLLATAALCTAQATDDSHPASSNVMGAQYPRIHADLRATFRLKAPDAQKVRIDLAGTVFDMKKEGDGYWVGTTAPLVPGFHYYSLNVDGVAVNDPSSETFYGYNRESSGIEVPEAGVDFYLPQNVPHGELRERWYYSRLTEAWRRAMVYTPPGYDSGATRYPVLYLQHGAGENERSWGNQGHVAFIMDNLLAAGRTKPMLIVMDRGYASKPGEAAPANGGPRSTTFEEVVMKELIPTIDATYRTLSDRDHRAMAGLSMGGGQTLQITMKHLDQFAYIGAFSGVGGAGGAAFDAKTAFDGAMADTAAFNQRVKLLWLGIGTVEPERMMNSVRAFKDGLTKAGIRHVYFESPGTAHEWQTWRRDLAQFAPLLFR